MHETGADRPDQAVDAARAKREDDKDMPASRRDPDRLETLFRLGVGWVGKHRDRCLEYALDLANRHAVDLAFVAVGLIPLEAGNRRRSSRSHLCRDSHLSIQRRSGAEGVAKSG